MAPISKYNLTIAPPFYISQVDLARPFKAYYITSEQPLKFG